MGGRGPRYVSGPPPQNFDWPLKIVSEHPEMCKIFKIFRSRRAYEGRAHSFSDFKL